VTVRSFDGRIPRIGEGSYVHPSADVFGDVTIGRGCWIGPGARLRGDYGTIVVGDYSSIEERKGGDQNARFRWNRTWRTWPHDRTRRRLLCDRAFFTGDGEGSLRPFDGTQDKLRSGQALRVRGTGRCASADELSVQAASCLWVCFSCCHCTL